MADTDDGSVDDSHDLLRRVHPRQVVFDQNLGVRRPSSAAFKDPEMSTDSEHLLNSIGETWAFCLKDYSGYSLARFKAGAARALQLPVIAKPIDGNSAHVEVHGKKTQGTATALVLAATWVHLEN
ncbi:hypothetical protein [Bradyrhizobium sp. SZCCHNR3003]|uniref:hypothetical protein n=1 Tax=Bradyrhizobium sp. SZCCHNR3003 TaxID=3057387 RepID=UPI002916AFF5|nr:hypothetical protein [Bradyrhizobium sp. SZCCHNR3003]